ncbi:hypothetical protein EDF57_103555 [Novosphingobium sp. PhB55]|uniref:hypothetical protein n=1 Tax=Novosphingobium sp. PhB55 TaxID=2485106 RepID=UPI001066C05B|nr:hypothetical protein [Novosphingobium sp. PhB55]TDW65371.1 hypothetical protein EDF57_103555 [Novosphingobium sp. PhB55]
MNRTSTGNKPVFSASSVRDTIAETLASIKEEDSLTYADMGRVMGKSGDRAEAYCNGDFSDMSGFSLLAAWREWNGRFVGPLRTLVEGSRPGGAHCDHAGQSAILKAALAISVALQDGEVDPEEVRANRSTLESARDAIDAQLAKLVRAA